MVEAVPKVDVQRYGIVDGNELAPGESADMSGVVEKPLQEKRLHVFR